MRDKLLTLGPTLGVGVVAWATKAEGSTTTVRLLAGTEVLLDPVVGPADQVGQVGMVLPAAAVPVGMAVTEDTSNERSQEGSTTGTPSGHDIRFFCDETPFGDV